MARRKMITIKLPPLIIETMDSFCAENQLTRTHYIEDLIRADLKRRKRIITKKIINKTWDDIEDMPLYPQIKIRDYSYDQIARS